MHKLKTRPPMLTPSHNAMLYLLLSHLAQVALGEVGDSSSGVTWVSPSATNIYASGDKMVASWSAPYGTTSPSFQLCLSDTQECGQAVWPNVKKLANGTYTITMTIPDLGGDGAFFIRMEDDDGDVSDTPVFKLQVSANQSTRSPTSESSSNPSDPSASYDQYSPSSSLKSSEKHKSENKEDRYAFSKTASATWTSGTSGATPSLLNSTATSIPTGSVSSSTLLAPTNKALAATAGDNKPSAVAIVVPLAIFAAALAGLIFSLRQRSKTRREAESDNNSSSDHSFLHRTISKNSTATVSSTSIHSKGQTDLERAMEFISGVQMTSSSDLAPTASTGSKQSVEVRRSGRESSFERNPKAQAREMSVGQQKRECLTAGPTARTIEDQALDVRSLQATGPPDKVQHSGPLAVSPGFLPGPVVYQLPTIPRALPLIEPLTYATLVPGNGIHPGSHQTFIPPGFESRGVPKMEMPWIPAVSESQIPGHFQHSTGQLYQLPDPTAAMTASTTLAHANLSLGIPPTLAGASIPVQAPRPIVPSVSRSAELTLAPPILPPSLRIARPKTQEPLPMEHQLYSEVVQLQGQPAMCPSIPYATRPSTSSGTISSTLSGLPNPYAAIEMALRAGN